MATFKSYVGKKVATPSGVVEFKAEELSTDDKEVIEALKKAKDVSESGGKPKPKDDGKGDKK